MLWVTIYLGPTLAMASPFLLGRILRVKRSLRVTSIADFISARYAKSQAVAALVTVMLLVGIVPYIALQLRGVTGTFELLTAGTQSSSAKIISPIVIVLMFVFTVMFGIRRLDPTERHPGMMVSLSVESIVKVVAFLAAGAFVTATVFGGLGGFFERLEGELPKHINFLARESTPNVLLWLTYLLLATSAFMFLPRQFHVAVVENSNPRHLRTASWLVPVYLLVINLFVLPITLGGLVSAPTGAADQFVLSLPLLAGRHTLTAFVFIGGFSAAVGMLMVETMTMATMVSNHLVLPLLESSPRLWGFRRHLLYARWVAAGLLILASYGFEVGVGQSVMLVNMGMLSFAAVTQFAPSIVGGLFWNKGSKAGALAGLSLGFVTWVYTLLLPTFVRSHWLSQSFLDHGPGGIEWLRPEALFGLSGMPGLAHGTLWSLVFNLGGYVIGSSLFAPTTEELRASQEFLGQGVSHLGDDADAVADIVLAEKRAFLESLVARYHTPTAATEIVRQALETTKLADKEKITVAELAELQSAVERILAGAIGTAAAHSAMDAVRTQSSAQESAALAKVYARLLAGLNMAPSELRRKIDYHQERETLLRGQADELRGKMELLDREVDERRKAEKALQELNDQLEGRVAERTRALQEAQRKIVDVAHQAGRAEIATSILHNVGNVLNSVNVSLASMIEIVDRSRLPLLAKTAGLLEAHLADMAGFFTKDPRGKQVPALVIALAKDLTEEQKTFQTELELLAKNIEHIKVIISVQQTHAKASRLTEALDIAEVMEDAVRVNAAGLDQARIKIVRKFGKVPEAVVEKHKVLQILVNLVSNAKHAMSALPPDKERTLELGVKLIEGDRVELSVTDSGVGISTKELGKVFQHGYTTRSDGHGFGLHGSAIAATQMKGSLTVHSEGPGRGATFALTLPRNPSVAASTGSSGEAAQ